MTERDGELRNRVYSYDWNGKVLMNKKLILDLPGEPGPFHNGGKMAIGPDGYLYVLTYLDGKIHRITASG